MSDSVVETYAYARRPGPNEANVPLSDAYLRAVAKIEALPRNQGSADKTWVEEAIREWERHYRSAVRVR